MQSLSHGALTTHNARLVYKDQLSPLDEPSAEVTVMSLRCRISLLAVAVLLQGTALKRKDFRKEKSVS
jgi:hypothetical protein